MDNSAVSGAASSERNVLAPIIGIDLGTSTSAIAHLADGRAELLQDEQGDRIIPSVVQLTQNLDFAVGSVAKHSAITYHDRTTQEVKRLMGTKELVRLASRTYRPEEIAAQILAHLKRAAESKLGEGTVRDIVLSVPARFENDAREATKRAAEMVGLNVLRLINEPTAAALSYGLDRLREDQKILVFDFGGGTLDVTVLEMFGGVLEVKTSVGDDKLGGKDVDDLLIKLFREKYTEQHEGGKLPPPSRDRKLAQTLKEAAESYKKQLSFVPVVPVDLPYLSHEGGISFDLTRETLDDLLEELLMRAMALVNEALSRARLRWEAIDVILPVGGSSRLGLFRRALEAQWGRPIREYDNPDEAVAKGAAIAAGIERRAFEDSHKDIMILDVSPHRLGVAAIRQVGPGQFIDGYFSEIIPKDAKLPATQRRQYGTLFGSEETPISIQIYEATTDSNLCQDHRLIAELPLRRLKAGGSGEEDPASLSRGGALVSGKDLDDSEMVQVEFRYTLDGTLDVSVRYVSAPIVRVEGRFALSGGNGSEMSSPSIPEGASMLAGGSAPTAPGSMIAAAMARWRDTPSAELCAPLLDQAERLQQEHPEAAVTISAASDAVKFALVAGDEREVRQKLDALTDLLFDMA
ncbi:MAG: Hsp70 family protein [Cytophagales bacterium]|nr:Hsp70 family protein [Armatimonadota bacterium]